MSTPNREDLDGTRTATSAPAKRSRTAVGRYLLATVAGVAANLSLYLSLATQAGIHEPIANLMAALLVMGPRFCLHKYWVWEHRSPKRIGRELGVHGGLTVAGLALSTVVAAILAAREVGPLPLAIGNVSAFGVIWLTRFLVSHLYLFVEQPAAEANTDTDERGGSGAPGEAQTGRGGELRCDHLDQPGSAAGAAPVPS